MGADWRDEWLNQHYRHGECTELQFHTTNDCNNELVVSSQ
jgi:hypothetical protein